MSQNSKDMMQEKKYLNNTLEFINNQLESEYHEIGIKEEDIISYRRKMYENASHHAQDFNRLSETVQYLNPLVMQAIDYEASQQRIELYEKMKKTPYFARVDFNTPKWGEETIYIGIGNLENEETFESYVYDWRAPISSIFYRYELGPASYEAPSGTINGEITLKRQFEIENGNLAYFIDSSVNILDDILKETLSKNTSPQMRTIVETIQREQDVIIRDVDSDLLIVQGVAGSGKTSIALHRVAYLMYEGLRGRLKSSDMVLISPNQIFGQYIANVLPELGEENIDTITFERLIYLHFDSGFDFVKRNEILEEILTSEPDNRKLLQDNVVFKSSGEFLDIINRLIYHYEHSMIEFTDIMYDGKTIASKDLLKARFLESTSRSLPVQVRLNHIETIISERIQAHKPYRLRKLEDFVAEKPEKMLDIKTTARLLNTKQVSRIMKGVRAFTRINYLELYKELFAKPSLFKRLSKDIPLPQNIDQIIQLTSERLQKGVIDYNDAMALFLLKLRMDSSHENIDIRQVVVDEAQDYSPVHFEVLARLYPNAKYTVLGDVNQTIVDLKGNNIYSSIQNQLKKRKSTLVTLNKSFRCSYEISTFAAQFADKDIDIQQLDRHEEKPKIISAETSDLLNQQLVEQLIKWQNDGYNTIAVVCKNARESKELFNKIIPDITVKLVTEDEPAPLGGVGIIPVYLAKGLEFDAVAIYETNMQKYYTNNDRRLLYISATRALHRLSLFHTGELSGLITR